MNHRITSLTAAQSARFPEFVAKWTNIGLETSPANRAEAERGVRIAYEAAGLPPPEKIVWCGSPLAQGLTRAIVFGIAGGKIKIPELPGPTTDPGASVWASVWDSVRASVGDSVWASVWASVGDSVGASVWASVGDSVGASVWANVGNSVGDSVRDSGYGQHDANWLGFYDYFAEVCNLSEETRKLSGLWLIAKNAGWFLPHRNVCWIAERHNVLRRDDGGRLHCEDGPALSYPDGFSIWAWHGMRVSQQLIEQPETITVAQIEKERNAEIRRVMITRYDPARYLVDSGAEEIHSDEFGTLYRKLVPDDEPIMMVKVVNSTPEPDGSFKDYFLRVHPELRPILRADDEPGGRLLGDPQRLTARNAVASTSGLRGEEYAPLVET